VAASVRATRIRQHQHTNAPLTLPQEVSYLPLQPHGCRVRMHTDGLIICRLAGILVETYSEMYQWMSHCSVSSISIEGIAHNEHRLTSTDTAANERILSFEHILSHHLPPIVPHLDELIFKEIDICTLKPTQQSSSIARNRYYLHLHASLSLGFRIPHRIG
jgi:hypothetical protein